MRLLLLGATGFIGSEVARALAADGHEVTGFGRDAALARRVLPGMAWRSGDLRQLQSADDWLGLLGGIDGVVNASGTLQTGLRDDVGKVQSGAIRALVSACKARGIGQFIQISASNAAQNATQNAAGPAANPFMASKADADAFLAASGLPHTILRPGLVIGRNAFGGTEMLRMAASLPGVLPDPRGTRSIQCIAMADLVAAVRRALADPGAAQGGFDLVEAEGRSLGEVIRLHRQWLGFGEPTWRVRLPLALLRPATWLADACGWLGWRSPLRSNAIAALAAGVSGDAGQAAALLGRPALSLPQTLAALPPAGKADRWQARCALVFPLAMACLLALWLGSGVIGLVQRDAAEAVLAGAGFGPALSRALVLGGSLADIALALLLALRPTARIGLLGMAGLALGYVLAAALFVPALWLDPLAPMLKVLPAIALSLLCLAMLEER